MTVSWPQVDRPELVQQLVRGVLDAADPAPATAVFCDRLPAGAARLIAFGKASATMAASAARVLGRRIEAGLVIGPPERVEAWRDAPSRFELIPADHPLPTERNIAAAERALAFVAEGERDMPIVALVSGGGSAQMTLPAGSLTLDDVREVSDAMMRAGATIDELNAVRKHCDRVKGGRLGVAAGGRRVYAAVVSDVIDDRLDVISSGPFAPDASTYAHALAVLEYRDARRGHDAVARHLSAGLWGEHPETPKPGDPRLAGVTHEVIAGNAQAVAAAVALLPGAPTMLHDVSGEARESGVTCAREAIASGSAVLGGEPTVSDVPAEAKGGPMQEAALAAALELERSGRAGWLVVGIATDGVDGPTDAAGAAIDAGLLARMRESSADPEPALVRHDSYRALEAAGCLIRTGPTGTNVNDVLIAVAG